MSSTLLDDTIAALETNRGDTMLRVLECKAAAGETATEVLDLAMRVCGGAAYRNHLAVERSAGRRGAVRAADPSACSSLGFDGESRRLIVALAAVQSRAREQRQPRRIFRLL